MPLLKALVTGFEPWEGSLNPSGTIAKELNRKKFGRLEVIGLEVPEDFYSLPKLALSLVRKHRPDVVISLGWDYTPAIKVEKIALNVMNAEFGGEEVPDNSGNVPKGSPVVRSSPLAYTGTLPVESIVQDIRSAGIPVFRSYNAGTHCCNTIMYSFLRAAKTQKKKPLSGHIHLPPVPGMETHLQVKPMELETERRAVEIAIGTCGRYVRKR